MFTMEGGGKRTGQDTNGLRPGDGIRVGGTSGADEAGQRDRTHGKDEHLAVNDVNELLRVVQRKVTVKGSGGVVATVVVTARRGKVWMSIQPPFTWDAIMEPGMVEELIRTLALAAEDAEDADRQACVSWRQLSSDCRATPLTVSQCR